MKVKLRELIQAQALSGQLRQAKPEDMKLRYRVARNLRLIEQELRTYDELRTKLLEELGAEFDHERQEYGLGEKRLEFERRNRQLLEEEVELDLHSLTLEQVEALDLDIGTIAALSCMVGELE